MNLEWQPQISAQTQDWVVIDKPAFWLTNPPGFGSAERPVLSQWLSQKLGQKIWICHRIDLETSGLVLFALTPEFHKQANLWFEQNAIKKEYLFLAQGVQSMPSRMVVAAIAGKPAKTQVLNQEQFGDEAFLGMARPQSGRRHQIRIHLASLGNALLGDTEYGGTKNLASLKIERVMLHASKLQLPTGEVFHAPLPLDFSNAISKIKDAINKDAKK